MWRFLLLPSYLTSSFLHPPVEMASSDESGIEKVIASSSALPNEERHTERVLGKKGLRGFLVVEHTANLRKNSKISAIWHHGEERRRLDDDPMARYWRCGVVVGKPPASAMVPRVEDEGRIVARLLGNALLGDNDE